MNRNVKLNGLSLKFPGLFWGLLVSLLLLSACTFHNPAPVVDHSKDQARQSQDPAGSYRVRTGDTMFGIAFSYGLDQRELAAWNNISEPYTIYPDQLLNLTEPSGRTVDTGEVTIYKAATPQATTTRTYSTRDVPPATAMQKTVPAAPATQAPATRTPSLNTQKPVPPAVINTQKPVPPAVTSTRTQVPPAVTSSQKPVPPAVTSTQTPVPPAVTNSTPAASTAKPAASIPTPPPASKPAVAQSHADPSSWRWPTSGRVLRGFVAGDPARNGLDIAGMEGQAIQATASGTVVYSGNGLIGYGELIIIKHSDNMLSAYAHNKVRLANEGQQVTVGEKIAEMGRNDRNEQLLHFEIRARGKPVNPLTYLPKQ